MIVKNISYQFSNGVAVVNTTPHPITFLSPEGETVTVGTSVPAGEKNGFAVVNAFPEEEPVDEYTVRTVFRATEAGEKLIAELRAAAEAEYPNAKRIFVVGSLAAANAYAGIVGMIPAPGFERVPPAEKRMSCCKFNQGDVQ